MKTIILKSLRLLNFKGVRDFAIKLNGNTDIFGANESGKSTLYTAFTWLLTGKDEFDRKDYEIKNTKNKDLNVLSHEVEAVIEIDGREEKIKRVYSEKWVKQRGQSEKVFTGHETEFFYNDVPCNLGEYQSKVDAIIKGEIIKLVTNPTYFNSLNWQDQRKGLLMIAGKITDSDIIDSIATPKNDYGNLINILNSGKSAEDYKKEIAAKKLLLKKAGGEFEPRIDEAKRGLPEVRDWKAIEAAMASKLAKITDLQEQLDSVLKAQREKQKGITQLNNQVFEKQNQITNIRQKIKSQVLAKQNEGAGEIDALQSKIKAIQQTITTLKKSDADKLTNIASYKTQVETKEAIIVKLRAEWNAINAETFVFDNSKCECPTCKQQLPAADIEKQKETMLKNFNDSVAQRKASKVDYSNIIKQEKKQLEENIANLESLNNTVAIIDKEAALEPLFVQLEELQSASKKKQVDDVETAVDALMRLNGDALNLADEIKTIQIQIASATAAMDEDDSTEVKAKKAGLETELKELERQLADKDTIERMEARILQLKNEESANAQAIADLEKQEFEIESYTRAKMDILQERVNSRFKYVKFRMFETQVNGGIAETCVCEYNGVPYPTLNTAAKLLAGLDVLNTLSNHYQVSAPVFCDNRESVTFIPETNSQIISLFVSPADKKLRIETAEPTKHKIGKAMPSPLFETA